MEGRERVGCGGADSQRVQEIWVGDVFQGVIRWWMVHVGPHAADQIGHHDTNYDQDRHCHECSAPMRPLKARNPHVRTEQPCRTEHARATFVRNGTTHQERQGTLSATRPCKISQISTNQILQ